MKLAMIGFGQAGGKIVDKFLEYDAETGSNIVRAAVAVNSAKADLMGLEHIPEKNRVLIGQSRVKGHGVGADNELGAEIAEEDIDEIQGSIDSIPVHEVDAFLVVAGLGGGTGSGGAPVIAKHLKRIYTEPVYGLGVLPGSDEGGIYTLNAARSFQTFVREVDNLLVFDNDSWRKTGESVQSGYDEINSEIVRRFGILFGAGEGQAGPGSRRVGRRLLGDHQHALRRRRLDGRLRRGGSPGGLFGRPPLAVPWRGRRDDRHGPHDEPHHQPRSESDARSTHPPV